MNRKGIRAQALVELAVLIPIVLVIFAGLYVACRTAFFASRAQSAAQTEALRAGRGHSGIEDRLANAILPGESGACVTRPAGGNARVLPAPFPSLAGRAHGVASVNRVWAETRIPGQFPPLQLVRSSELSADCWGAASRSGKNVRRMVRAHIALGAVR